LVLNEVISCDSSFSIWFVLQLIYEPSAEIRELQKKMSSLLEKQKRKGGVIDVEQERNKFLIDITSVCICKVYTDLIYFLKLGVITCPITVHVSLWLNFAQASKNCCQYIIAL